MTAVIQEFFIDFERCIGCNACVAACAECHTHRGRPMIHVDKVDEPHTPQTSPMVCMHCVEPTCALSCPADAIKRDEQGIVHSSLRPRCIACRNCELSCPFGVPIIDLGIEQMQKCDMCFDRTSTGKKPMCATVCPSQALWYGTREEIERMRPASKPINRWRFGNQVVETRNLVMVPHNVDELVVDWPGEAMAPGELAMRLRRQAEEPAPPSPEEALPPLLEPVGAQPSEEEAEFL